MSRRATVRFRLRLETPDGVRVFPLAPGESVVGSHPDCDAAVCHPAVSRRHAVIVCDARGLLVRDAGSKNGTTVNGQAVTERELRDGDRIGLGPVSLVVERSEDDGALAIDLGRVVADEVRELAETQTRSRSVPTLGGGSRWLRLLSRVARRGRAEGAEESLELIRSECDALAAAWLEGKRGEEPAVRAIAGDAGALSRLEPARELIVAAFADARTQGVARSVVVPGHEGLAAAARVAGEVEALLAVLGTAVAEPDLGIALEVLLALLAPATPTAGRRRGSSPDGPELVFPEGYVPGTSSAMRALYAQMRSLVAGDLPVLVTGETGSGKELVARTLHLSSPARRKGPFQAINCAAVPAELLEAELFGVERGAATGVLPRPGQLLLANGGVLFLDEIGEMPLALQAKLLRALQSMEVHPVGARRPIKVDVRVISATNAVPEVLLESGRLRTDLYYRIAGWTLRVPSLAERREDLPRFVEAFVRRYASEARKAIRGVSAKALDALSARGWPGGVRELEMEMRRLVQLCPEGGTIDTALLGALPRPARREAPEGELSADADLRIEPRIEALERRLIVAALGHTKGNRSHAAELLGISRDGLRMKMERLGIEV